MGSFPIRPLVRWMVLTAVVAAGFGAAPALADQPNPTANPDSYATGVNAILTVAPPGVLANDTDALTAMQDTVATNGSVTLSSTGGFSYVPNQGFRGTDSFTYHASHGNVDSAPATVTITVDDPPIAADDGPYVAHRGQTLNVDATGGVLANDTDANADSLTAALDTNVGHGALTLNADGSFDYTPEAGYTGADQFTYHASDGLADSATATVTISVVNDAPVAADDAYATAGDQTLSVAAAGVLANDSDPNGDALSAVLGTDVSHGSLTLNGDGSFSYLPGPGVCNRTDQFTYEASDGDLSSAAANATITIETALKAATLTLQRSATHVAYGRGALITAHLTAFSPSAVISIYGTPAGGTRHLLARRSPGPLGNLAVRVQPTRRTSYRALSTDNCYVAGDSGPKVVEVAPRVEGHMVGFFDRDGPYALYHSGGRAPHYHGSVTPDHSGLPVKFVWQRLADGSWKAYFATRVDLNEHSAIHVFMTSGVVPDRRYRVRIVFLADGDHLARAAPWAYFRAT